MDENLLTWCEQGKWVYPSAVFEVKKEIRARFAMRPNFTGIWKADLTRTKLIGPQPAEIWARIQHSEPAISLEMFVATADGGKHRIEFELP